MANEKFLHCYKMVWDTEFAPNPHHNVLTLATCKPRIRKYAEVGDWISGWTAVKVHDKDHKTLIFPKDNERLIYLALVTEKLSFEKYWNRYDDKKPHRLKNGIPLPIKEKGSCGAGMNSDNALYDSGDNIYEPDSKHAGKFIQHPNGGEHGDKEKERDLSGEYVLICKEFYYFGVHHACEIPFPISFRPIPRWKKVSLDDAEQFISFIQKNHKSCTITNNENNTK